MQTRFHPYPFFRLILFISLISLVSISCTRRIELVPTYPGDEPVMNALIAPDSVLTVWLTLTLPALTPPEPDSFPRIEDARVWILQEEDTLEQLSHTGGGYYRSLQGFTAEAGNSYRFVALLANGDTLTHNSVRVPPAVTPSLIEYGVEQGPAFNPSMPNDLITFSLSDPPGSAQFYEIDLYPSEAPSERLGFGFRQNDNGLPEACQQYGLILPDACFDGEEHEISVWVNPNYVDDSTFNGVRADSLSLRVYTWSESNYLRVKTDPSARDALDQIFFRTDTRYSNVIGGYGIVVARNGTQLNIATQ